MATLTGVIRKVIAPRGFGFIDSGGKTYFYHYTKVIDGTCSAPPTGATTYTFDANGDEVATSSGASFTYNAKDQTTAITNGGATLSPLTYSGTDQTQRTAAGSTNFNSGPSGVQISTSGASSTYYLRDSRGNLVGERVGTNHYYYLMDALGSIVAVIGGDGLTVGDRYGYDPFGSTTYRSGAIPSPWGYAGGYTDSTGLTKFGTRYYDPASARWTQADPVALPNRYIYVGCDPINYSDPSGAARVIGACGISTLNYNHWTGDFYITLNSLRGSLLIVSWEVSLDGWWWWLANTGGWATPGRGWWTHSGRVPFANWDSDAHHATFTGWVFTSRRMFCSIGPAVEVW